MSSLIESRGVSSPLADVHVGYGRTTGDLPEGISGIKGRTVLGADFYKPEFYVFGRRERRGVAASQAVKDDARLAVVDLGRRHRCIPSKRSWAIARNSSIPVASS